MYARFTSAGPLPSVLLNFLSSLVMPVVTQPPNSVNFSDDEDSASDRWNLRIDELLDNRVPESTKRVNNWAETKFASWLRTVHKHLFSQKLSALPDVQIKSDTLTDDCVSCRFLISNSKWIKFQMDQGS